MLKKIFCNHKWEKICFVTVEENNLRFSIRTYKCNKCGKTKKVDSRCDSQSN